MIMGSWAVGTRHEGRRHTQPKSGFGLLPVPDNMDRSAGRNILTERLTHRRKGQEGIRLHVKVSSVSSSHRRPARSR
jgi:hypothetical protein